MTVSMNSMHDRREQRLTAQQLVLLGAAIGSPAVAQSLNAEWFADDYIKAAITEIQEVIAGDIKKEEMIKLPGALAKHADIVIEGDKNFIDCIRDEVELRGRAYQLRKAAEFIRTANVDALETIELLKQKIAEV